MKWIQTQNTYFKNTTICFNWKEAIWSLTEKKENIIGNKKEKLTESLHLIMVEMTWRSNNSLIISENFAFKNYINYLIILITDMQIVILLVCIPTTMKFNLYSAGPQLSGH